jgi:cytidine deaminase
MVDTGYLKGPNLGNYMGFGPICRIRFVNTCRTFAALSPAMENNSKRISISMSYVHHASQKDLPGTDQELLQLANFAAARAYAPYSKFHVGAALRMADGTVITGNNQENASFPAGICAERTAMHAAMSQWPKGIIREMAVVVPQVKGDMPVSPCGICRQALLEQEFRQGTPLRLLLGLSNGVVFEMESARSLLPLSFDGSFL